MVCGSPKESWSSALFSFFLPLPIFPGWQENVDIIINGMGLFDPCRVFGSSFCAMSKILG